MKIDGRRHRYIAGYSLLAALLAAAGGLLVYTDHSAQQHSAALYNTATSTSDDPLDSEAEVTDDSQSAASVEHGTVTNKTQTDLEINGRNIPVPANGELHETYTDGGSTTTVHISNQTHSTSTSTNIDVDSHSSSSGDDDD